MRVNESAKRWPMRSCCCATALFVSTLLGAPEAA